MSELIETVDAGRYPDHDKSDEQQESGLEVAKCFCRLFASLDVGGMLSRAEDWHLR